MSFRLHSSVWLGLALGVAITVCPRGATALDAKKPEAAGKPVAGDHKPHKAAGVAALSDVQRQFCLNNAATAADERVAWEVRKIAGLEGTIKQRIADLEAKRAEYADWLKKRDEAMKKAEDGVVAIYAKMRPDAAASQIAAMDDAMAAAIISKLNSRVASAVLAEMEPGRAARIASSMVGPPTDAGKKKS